MEKHKVCDVPEGQSGEWAVQRFTVSEKQSQVDQIRGMFGSGRYTRPGTYTRLVHGRSVVMSDTHDEISDHRWPISLAKGQCLVNGLGIGVVLNAMLSKHDKRGALLVERVIVVEKSADVLDLVADHYLRKFGEERLTLIHADAFEYQPKRGQRFDVVWHDIWPTICGNNWEGMKRLHRKYGRRADWQGSWCRAECKRLEMESQREERERNRWMGRGVTP